MLKTVFTLDLGNSHPHVGYFQEGKLKEVLSWRQFTQKFPASTIESSQLIICQVGDAVEGLSDYLPLAINAPVFHQQQFLSMPVHYSETLGRDRLYCAYHVYDKIHRGELQAPVAMVDAGTFMTLDLIDQQGFKGGYILPGLSVFLQSYARGHQLPTLQETSTLQEKLPQTTVQAISEGAQLYIKQVIRGFLEKTQPQSVILTGGSSEIVLQYIQDRPTLHEPHWIHWAMNSLANYCHPQADLQSRPGSQ